MQTCICSCVRKYVHKCVHTCVSTYIRSYVRMYVLFFIVSIQNITLQPDGYSQNTVGQRQEVICSIFVPPYADPDDIELGWLNENEIITSDSRVTVSTSLNYFMNNTKDTIIQFDPLIEDDDENEYYCYAIINGSFVFELTKLQNFTSTYAIIMHAQFNTFMCMHT